MYILRKMQYVLQSNEWCTYPYCCLLLSWKSWNWFECVVGGVLICFCFCVVAYVSMVSVANWKGTGEQNPLFQLAIDTMLTSATTRKKKQINTPPTTHSHQFQLFHDSSRQQYGYVHHYSIELIAFSAKYTLFNNCNFNLVCRYSLSVKFNSVYYSVMVTRYCS